MTKTSMNAGRAMAVFMPAMIMIFFSACNPRGHFEAQTRQLDSLLLAIDSASAELMTIDSAFIQSSIDSSVRHISYVQDNYAGEMNKHLAIQISEYRAIGKQMPDFSKKYSRARKEMAVTARQLHDLKTAMAQGATVDAEGHEMDAKYFANAVGEEVTMAKALLEETARIHSAARFITIRYDSLFPILKPVFDSIPLKAVK